MSIISVYVEQRLSTSAQYGLKSVNGLRIKIKNMLRIYEGKCKETFTEMKEKYEYERAKGAKINHQTFINKLKRDFDGVFFRGVLRQIVKMKPCKIRFKEIEHIDIKA